VSKSVVGMSHKKIRQSIIETCLEINRSGLNQGTSGNLSHRVDGGMLITPTSLPYDRMKPNDIVEMAFDGTYSGHNRPSSEWRFHRDILKNRTDVNIVLHTHSVYSTTLAVHEKGIPSFHYMVAVAGGTDIRCSPYKCFGTQELSDVALEALEGRTACLLGHHGLIVLADTFEKALWRAHEVETLAKMYVHALAIGEPPRLSEAEMAQVIEQIRRMSYGQAPDLDRVNDTPKPVRAKAVAHTSSVAQSVRADEAATKGEGVNSMATAPKKAAKKAAKKTVKKAAKKTAAKKTVKKAAKKTAKKAAKKTVKKAAKRPAKKAAKKSARKTAAKRPAKKARKARKASKARSSKPATAGQTVEAAGTPADAFKSLVKAAVDRGV
jgi:L-fuculose-phosphate aldolase